MTNRTEFTPEELQKLLEKAQKDVQSLLDKMTPEERERAEANAQKMIAEDKTSMQKLIEDAAKVAADTAPKEKGTPKFCTNCGAPASGGKFCTYCGSPLQNGLA